MSRHFRYDDTSKWIDKFGVGTAGNVTVSGSATDNPTDSACSGTALSNSLSATNASFAAGQIILIIQMKGTGAGNWELNKIASYTSGTITTTYQLQNTYSSTSPSKAQVIACPQFSDFTVNSGVTLTAKAWDGSVGGVVFKVARNNITIAGNITGDGKGFRGGGGDHDSHAANRGEGCGNLVYPYTDYYQTPLDGNGGGNGYGGEASGGGGGNVSAGSNGSGSTYGLGGLGSYGNSALTKIVMGGGGGGSVDSNRNEYGGNGGRGGAIIILMSKNITVTGTITSKGIIGTQGYDNTSSTEVWGGCGAGGSILLKCERATLGTTLVTALKGDNADQTQTGTYTKGGSGANGAIHIDYGRYYTGTTSPTIDARIDPFLKGSSGFNAFAIVGSL